LAWTIIIDRLIGDNASATVYISIQTTLFYYIYILKNFGYVFEWCSLAYVLLEWTSALVNQFTPKLY